MNDELTWGFGLAVIEWLLLLAALVVLAIIGAVVKRKSLGRSLKALRKLNGRPDADRKSVV